MLRSTWDYHRVPTMFAAWLQALEDSGRATWNPPSIARANVDKIYLKELEAAGIAIPKTRWIDGVDPRFARGGHAPRKAGIARVLKPRIAATAYGTFLIDRSDVADGRGSGAGAGVRRARAGTDSRGDRSRRDVARLLRRRASATRW